MSGVSLPAPLGFVPSGGDLPVANKADVLATFPRRARLAAEAGDAPVLDAVAEALLAMMLAYQNRASYAAVQSDTTRATGIYLAEFTGDVGIYPQAGEGDEALRDRYYTSPDVVTPAAVKAAVDGILARYTPSRCMLSESVLDRWFVADGTQTAWRAFVGDGTSDMTPDYPDRRYVLRGRCSPLGPRAWDDDNGREFLLLIPDLAQTSTLGAFARDPALGGSPQLFMFNGAEADPPTMGAFAFDGGTSAAAAYAAICNLVDTLRAHGVRWMLIVDPRL